VSISEPSTIAGWFWPREAQPVVPGTSAQPRKAWGLAIGPLGSDEILLEGAAKRLRAWAPPGVPLSATADEALQRWRVGTSPSGQALDPTAFSDVSGVAVGEVLDAVPRTLHAWVTATTHRALVRLELFVRTGMRVADGPMTTAQAAAAELRRELSEAHLARRAPVRVSRRASPGSERQPIAADGSVAAHVHRLIAALTSQVLELSLEHQRWRDHFEPLHEHEHDHDIGCGLMSSLAVDSLRELYGSSLWSGHASFPERLLQRYREVVTEMSWMPAVVKLKHLEPGGQMFSRSSAPPASPDGRLFPDDFEGYDGPNAHDSAAHAFLSAARWASEGGRDCEQAEHLIYWQLRGAWGNGREPDGRDADRATHIRALTAMFATHAAQPGEVSSSACEEDPHVGHRRVPVTERDGATDLLAQIVQAQTVSTKVVVILGSYPHEAPVSSLECDVNAGGPPAVTALAFALDRALHYLPMLVGMSAPARSAPHQHQSDLLPRGSRAELHLGRHSPGSCSACGAAPEGESTHCSAPLSMV
jgi:hypothetical protein